MDKITLSMEVLAAILGKSREELVTALTVANESGEKTPKSQEELDSYLKSGVTDRIKKAHTDGKEEGKGFGKRTAFLEVEEYLGKEFSLSEGNWEDRLKNLKPSESSTSDPSSITPEIVRNSEFYIEDMKKLKAKLKEEQDNHQQTISSHKKEKVNSVIESRISEMLTDPQYKFQIPEGKEKVWKNVIVSQVQNSGNNYQLDEKGIPLVLSKDNNPLRDEMLNDVSFDNYVLGIAKDLIPVAVSDKKETPDSISSSTNNQTIQNENVPQFKNLGEYETWLDKASQDPKMTPEVFEAAQSQLSNLEN